jgi:hypothetical protein
MSEVKVNKISPRTNCGTVTLGDSGDTFSIPAGVTLTNSGTATGFGPTGAVSWNTTKITADPNPAVSGVGYFADTTSSAFTVTLPAAPSAGDIVALSDYTGTFVTNNLTVGRNGSNIRGSATDLVLNVNNQTVTLIYVDATEGWNVIQESNNINNFVAATGGTITTCGDYKIHTFTGPGTFCVSAGAGPVAVVDYLVVAGGGGRRVGGAPAGGGGAGGYRESSGLASGGYSVSPLGSGVSALPVSVTAYPITVGAGGAPSPTGGCGSNSVFSSITSAGGGAAGISAGISGGSGGGAGSANGNAGGAGNTPPVSPSQGNAGGTSCKGPASVSRGGGGGGAGASGIPGSTSGNGGAGVTSSIDGTPTTRAGGGGGGSESKSAGTGGAGGGGNGGQYAPCAGAQDGTANTGGGSGNGYSTAKSGGSGIVIIRYKFQ